MKNRKLILSLSAAIGSATLFAPIATIVTSCSKTTQVQFALLRTSQGYCVDSIVNSNRTEINDLVVPESIDGIPVVEISKGAFKGCTNLKSITLPFIGRTKNSIGQGGLFGYIFGDEMWEGCGAYTWQAYTTSDQFEDVPDEFAQFAIPAALQEVTITSACTISAGAFSNCRFLKHINFKQDSNATTATEIGNYAFYNCMSLKSFEFPSSVKTIGREAFDGCTSIRTIEIPNSVTTIKHNAFKNCVSASKATIPTSVTSMGKLVFENFLSGLVMVEAETVPEGWDSNWITQDVSVVYGYTSGGVYYTSNGQYAVCGKDGEKYAYMISWLWQEGQTTLEIPGTVVCGGTTYPIKKIGPNVFYAYDEVTKITIGENVETLGANCFLNCTALETINFPSTLKTIGQYCFYGCNKLHQHTSSETNEDVEGLDFNNVVEIGEGAFEGNTSITKVDLGEHMESIGNAAFKNCSYLTPARDKSGNKQELIFPKTIKSIGDYAFYNIAKYRDNDLTNVDADILFENNNQNEVSIGVSAFEGATVRTTTSEYKNLIYMNINFNHVNVKKFSDNAFRDVYIREMINFPQELEEVGNYAFYNCYIPYPSIAHAATDRVLMIPDTVKKIGNYAFGYCSGCRFFLGNDSKLESIGKFAFRNDSYDGSGDISLSFKTFNIPDSVTTIGEYAFYGCSYLTSVKLPQNTKFNRLENYTFGSCTRLIQNTEDNPNKFVVPESVTYIGSGVFNTCPNIEYITIKGQITNLGSSCFAGCTSIEHGKDVSGTPLQSLVFEDKFQHLTSFGSNMYQGCKGLVYAPFPGSDAGEALSKITTIPASCFADCEKLSSFEVLSNIATIGKAAFRGCTGMSHVTNMSGVKVVNDNAFTGCKNLVTLAMPQGCHTICDNAFADCINISTFTLPTDITQAWSSSSQRGMGSTPFRGWGPDSSHEQVIQFRDANIKETKSSGNLVTWWDWELVKHTTGNETYYTCDKAGGGNYLKFVKI